jgi:uncharacterized NAD(P)/FAD-binding protein YdhS
LDADHPENGVLIPRRNTVGDFVSVQDETVLGFVTKGTKAKIQITPEIAINETNLLPRQAFIVALHNFAGLASDIVTRFDTN